MRAQSVLLTFLGSFVLDNGKAVFSGSVVDAFERVGIQEQATRSTLARMANRGLLERHRRGRRVYLGLTEHSSEILRDGLHRSIREPVDRQWDGTWTLLGFSLPDDWRRQRHDLRSRLLWAGFGRLQSGLWISPAEIDVDQLLAGLDLTDRILVFRSRPSAPTDIDELIRDAYDLERLAAQYRAFVERWESWPDTEPADALAQYLLVQTQWLDLVRIDPRLPLRHLPADWPSPHAERIFHRIYDETGPAARTIVDGSLDLIDVGMPAVPA
jgi:phenylacetic acid degradation operon negative regulatory protein